MSGKHLIVYSILLLTLASCKKDNSPEEMIPPPINVLCDGIPNQLYWPLQVNNEWTHKNLFNGSTIKSTVTKKVTFNGREYLEAYYLQGTNGSYFYFRIAANNDIIRYYPSSDKEYLEIPGSPTLNQEWTYIAGFSGPGKRKIAETGVHVKTNACTYENCIAIKEYDGMGNLLATYYFKQGLGLVKYIFLGEGELINTRLGN